MSTKSQAIKAFKEHKARLDINNEDLDILWFRQLIDLVEKYLGKESAQYKQFFFARTYNTIVFSKKDAANIWRFSHQIAIKHLDSFIYYIEQNGVYKSPQTAGNMFGTLSNEAFFGTVSLIIAGSFYLGFLFRPTDPMPRNLPSAVIDTSNSSNSPSNEKTLQKGKNIVKEIPDTLTPIHK